LVALFVVWGNTDERCLFGLSVVALVWFGRLLDQRPAEGFWRALGLRAAGVAVLAAAACVNPSHVKNLDVPPELRSAITALRADESGSTVVNSPFTSGYLDTFRESPAALAYFPLAALGLLSFLLNRVGWRWAWALPWLALGIVSGIQVRSVPFFAVVAGPVTAWNLVAFFARRGPQAPLRPWARTVARALTGLLALAFLACAWPGWLQGPPFEPRQWVLEVPGPARHAADLLHRAHTNHLWPADARTLHVSANTAAAFAWFCPEDRGVRDESAVTQLLDPAGAAKARQQLRALGVTRVVVSAADSGSPRAVLDQLLADPEEWPVLHLTGGVVVFGWRPPTGGARGPNPYAGWEVDFTRLAFRPDGSEVAPPVRVTSERHWWHAFWKPAPPARPADRDEALVLLKKSQALIRSAPQRHQVVWDAGQMSALIGAASGWIGPAGRVDALVRLAYLAPPIPEKAPPNAPLPLTAQVALGLQQRFALDSGHTPVGILYASVRAGRRAVAENPDDANSYFLLAQAYGALVRTTAESRWAMRLPQLMRLRELQASAALNRAVALNPNLGEAHVELARFYLTTRCMDLAATHLRAYRDLPPNRGGPKKGDRRAEALLAELEKLTDAVNKETDAWNKETARFSVGERAEQAARRGLAGTARDLLLKSDVSAFGAPGMELELDLLLLTGRPDDVLAWMTPELRGSLGNYKYFWLRAQAHIALGDYEAADTELSAITGPVGGPDEHVGAELAGLVGKSVLDQQPAAHAPQIVMRVLSEFDFRRRFSQTGQQLGTLSDVLVLRGLVALEAGTIERARESFRAALAYSPNRWGGGQLEFNGRWVAWACLDLIASADAPRPRDP
jgi:tetratricopeptide (TPR) repeat protein